MNSLIALVLLGQIFGCTLSHHLGQQGDCNSKEAEQYAEEAVHHINAHSLHGYKQVLNEIENLRIFSRRPQGEIIFLKANLLETNCHVLDPTPLSNCTVRPKAEHAVEADCDIKLLSSEGIIKVLAAKCHSSPDSMEDVLKDCFNCPILLPLNDPPVIEAVEYVLHKYNSLVPDHTYEVLEISRAQHKVNPVSYYVEFAIVRTNCSDQEAHDAHHNCHPPAAADAVIGFCRATVFSKPHATEKLTDEKYDSDCVIFDPKDGISHNHLVEHHFGKNIPSPGLNHTVLDLAHSYNDTHASHESHSSEHVEKITAAVRKREVPAEADLQVHPKKLCPGKIHHFKV